MHKFARSALGRQEGAQLGAQASCCWTSARSPSTTLACDFHCSCVDHQRVAVGCPRRCGMGDRPAQGIAPRHPNSGARDDGPLAAA